MPSKSEKPRTAIVGGGAAGFFLALNLKETVPAMDVVIFERSQRVLAKVEVSGGGRCNCTNTFEAVTDLSQVYPRGHRLMKRLMNVFDQRDAYRWFEQHGVPLTVQEDGCVFPQAQDSHAVIDCFLGLAQRYGVEIVRGRRITSLSELADFDHVAVTAGGQPTPSGLQWLADLGHEIEMPVPSLFSLCIDDRRLTDLQGAVTEVSVQLTGTKVRAEGPLLITHWGMSGPAILRLSSYGARLLAAADYRMPLSVNWVQQTEDEVRMMLYDWQEGHAQQLLSTHNPFGLTARLWTYLLEKSLGERMRIRWAELNKKDVNRLVNIVTNDTYETAGRAPFKDEFVTCGGVSLKAVDAKTLESRHVPHLYFAGEVLDIDGVTGGFNFQAAWTTAYTVARSIVQLL